MRKYLHIVSCIFAGLSIIAASCEPAKDNPDDENQDTSITVDSLTGYVQKGPFLNGTSLSLYELNEAMTQTGRNFNTQILDNSGTFEFKGIELATQYAELKADGFYFNEILGETSAAQLTLYALSDLSDRQDVNVNVLSHLEKRRVEYLISQGMDFHVAKKQALQEILSIFEIENEVQSESESLDISKEGEENSNLLAVSLLLQGFRTTGELSELLANISADIYQDGKLDNDTLESALITQAKHLNTEKYRTTLEERYTALGKTATIPDFEQHINNFVLNTDFKEGEFIIYPRDGLYGRNILHDSVHTVMLKQGFSMAADLPPGVGLKVRFIGGLWGKSGTVVNWTYSWYNRAALSQDYESVEPGKYCDLSLSLYNAEGYRSVVIEYYENYSDTPTKVREVFFKEFLPPETFKIPEYGKYGVNILFEEYDTLSVNQSYSMKVLLFPGNKFTVKVENGFWDVEQDENDSPNWIVSPYDELSNSQLFTTSQGADTCDLGITFTERTMVRIIYSDELSGEPADTVNFWIN